MNFRYVADSIRIGFPMFLLQFCPMITTAVINNQIVIQGGSDLHIAAFGIFNAYMVYVMNGFIIGFNAGMQPIASVNYGAKANGRVRSLIKTGMIQSFIVILVVEIMVMVFANPLVEFFAGGAGELADITVGALRINIALFAFGSIATLVGGYYISIGKIGLALLNSCLLYTSQDDQISAMTASTMNTARHAPMATTMRPFLLYARKIAVSRPAAAETMLSVA